MGREKCGNKPGYHRYPMTEPKHSDEELEQMAIDLTEWVNNKRRYKLPIILSGFAVDQGMTRGEFQKCYNRNANLYRATRYAKNAQNEILIEGGLLKDSGFNANFIQFLLTHNDDYTPKEPKKDTSQDNAKASINNFYVNTAQSVESE